MDMQIVHVKWLEAVAYENWNMTEPAVGLVPTERETIGWKVTEEKDILVVATTLAAPAEQGANLLVIPKKCIVDTKVVRVSVAKHPPADASPPRTTKKRKEPPPPDKLTTGERAEAMVKYMRGQGRPVKASKMAEAINREHGEGAVQRSRLYSALHNSPFFEKEGDGWVLTSTGDQAFPKQESPE